MNRNPSLRLAALLLTLAPTLALALVPAPYSARYEVQRNGERLGEATVTLKALAGGRAELTSSTIASEGIGALTGVAVDERSLMRWQDGAPETVTWNYRQKLAWKTRQRSLKIDAGAKLIEHRDRDRQWSPPYRRGVLDRHAITVALMQDLIVGRGGELRYLVPDKDELKSWLFRVGDSERMDTRLGAQRAVRVERIRDGGDSRSTTLWLAQDRNFVPLRIRQKEANGDTVEMRITSLR